MVVGQPVVLQGQAVAVSIDPKVSPAPIKAEVINNEVRHAPTFVPKNTKIGPLKIMTIK